MDDRRFDAFIRTFGSRTSRRTVIRGLIGLGAGAATASVASEGSLAARRGHSGPKLSALPPPPTTCVATCEANDFNACVESCAGTGDVTACVQSCVLEMVNCVQECVAED